MSVEQRLVRTSDSDLAGVTKHRGFVSVSLPNDLATHAVERFLGYFSLPCECFTPEHSDIQELLPLEDGEWCVAIQTHSRQSLLEVFPAALVKEAPLFLRDNVSTAYLTFHQYTIDVLPKHHKRIILALEKVREDIRQDDTGAPLSWVQMDTPTATLHGHGGSSEQVRQCIEGPDALEALPPETEEDSTFLPRQDITQEFERIRTTLNLPTFPLTLYRGNINKNGFVTGRVFSDANGPLRMVLTTCPNADLAESFATLVHEFAHLSPNAMNHGASFKEAMIQLASELYGHVYFDAPRKRLHESYHILDMWLATGIRAALKQGDPPVAKDFDEQLTAGVVSRIQKMRALAANQPGTAEGITATAIANTQVTLFELGDYRIRLDADIDEQMIDRWLNIGKGTRWKRDLAFNVAEFCNVFALARPDKGWMHYFGKYRDIVAAEYLLDVCMNHVERRCARHIQVWKARQRGRIPGGKTRSEKVSFCTSAVEGVSDKMNAVRAHEQQRAVANPNDTDAQAFRLTSQDLQGAEGFASDEHNKRGMGWTTDSSKTFRYNEKGYEAGQSVQLNSGVGSGKVRGLLK